MTDTPPAVASLPSSDQAVKMLETFASIGATHFDVTFTHLSGGQRGFRRYRPLDEVKESMRPLVATQTRRQNNVIVRPRVEGATCIQLDDLDREKGARIAPAAFLMIETSPGSYQAWLAVKDAPEGFAARLRRGLGVDKYASGATRLAGTYNFKPKYAPGFPVVRIAARTRGKFATVDELEAMGVVAADIKPVEITQPAGRPGREASRWPSYQMCLDRAPESESRPGHPRGSIADFTWCKIALSWGHPVEATAARLMQESEKARENGEAYAVKTAQRAVVPAAQRNQKQLRP